MELIIQFIVLFLGLSLFFIRMEYKLPILIFTCMCLSSVFIEFIPYGNAPFYISNCFFLSEFSKFSGRYRQLRNTVLPKLMILMFLATILLIIFSPHYHDLKGIFKVFIEELLGKYFALAYAFICIYQKNNLRLIVKVVVLGTVLLTFWGFLNLIMNESPWLNITIDDNNYNINLVDYGERERFRVQSMFINPFDYGYFCCIILLFILYVYHQKIVSKSILWIILICSFFGILTCGSRTIWATSLISVAVYYIVLLPKKIIMRYSIFSLFVLVSLGSVVYTNFVSDEKKDFLKEAFSTDTNLGSDIKGSSIGMRIVQLGAVLYYAQDNYLFGRGKDFFLIDMGWGDKGKESLLDEDLWGLEGLYLNYLLERGIVGLLFWLVFYISLLRFFYYHRKKYRYESAMALGVITLYIVFCNSMGELLSVMPSLLFTGMMMALIIKDERIRR